jgi:hypothetical protein
MFLQDNNFSGLYYKITLLLAEVNCQTAQQGFIINFFQMHLVQSYFNKVKVERLFAMPELYLSLFPYFFIHIILKNQKISLMNFLKQI